MNWAKERANECIGIFGGGVSEKSAKVLSTAFASELQRVADECEKEALARSLEFENQANGGDGASMLTTMCRASRASGAASVAECIREKFPKEAE